MKVEKCRTCQNYSRFFNGCTLYIIESYLDEGDFDYRYYPIKDVKKHECEYKPIKGE